MRLSITSWSFTGCTLREACGISRALGLNAIDLGLLHGPALDRQQVLSDPKAAADEFAGFDIGCSNVYWLFGDGLEERALSKTDALDANLKDFETVCRFAKLVGARTLFVLPGVTEPGIAPETTLDNSARALGELLPIAQEAGLILTVEPHIGGILNSPARTLEMVERVDGLGLTLDYAHFVTSGFTQDQIDPLLPFAQHMHLRQARPGHLQVKWGNGTIDFGEIFERLRLLDYDGFLSLEYVHQPYIETLYDDVLTETIAMRDAAIGAGVRL
ncbi:MAG: sugar phosphate isomerase/epimerase [Silicimonas sp.]|nr:sugar phosphate isomerase/epimerase [Silicimonas sp.]NND40519.1 sugar phosphate isomerase/epimerase [Silicimonas sp.]